METLFFIFLALSIWHFIIQSMYIPNKAHDIKYQLYAKRDKLRMLFIEEKINEEEFLILDLFYSNLILRFKNISIIDFIFFVFKDKLESKNKFEKQEQIFESKMNIIDSCKNEDFIKLKEIASVYSLRISFLNSTGWLPYALVFVIIPYILIKFFNLKLFNPFILKIKSISNQTAILEENGNRLTPC